jgi:imidazolonepropionase-like amidohydrolase
MTRSLPEAALALAAVLFPAPDRAPAVQRPVAIVGATLIDGTGRAPQRDVTLLLAGGRIARIAPRTSASVPEDAVRIDATGRFVVPGLFDMHVHVHPDFYPLFLARGVTSIRDLGNFEPQIFRYRREPDRPGDPAPRLFVAGPILDGPEPTWRGSVSLSSAPQARLEVARLAAAGADFLKVYNGLSRDVLQAVIDEAHARGLRVTGHVPAGIDAREAILMGMDGIEHLTGVPLFAARAGAVLDRTAVDNRVTARWWQEAEPERLESLAALSASRGVFHCPTIFLEERWAVASREDLDSDPALRFVDPLYLRHLWVEQVHPAHGAFPKEDGADLRAALPNRMKFVGMLAKAGAPVLAGSDTPNPYVVPGYSLHEELRLLVRAGLSTAQALAAATTNAARFLGVADRLGTVEEGTLADLLVLSADPLHDIANLSRIEWVVSGGSPLSRENLDARLEALARRFEGREGGRRERPGLRSRR